MSSRTAYSNDNPHAFIAEIKVAAQSLQRRFYKTVDPLPYFSDETDVEPTVEQLGQAAKALELVFRPVYKKISPVVLWAKTFRIVFRLKDNYYFMQTLLEHIRKPKETPEGPHVKVTWTLPSLHGGTRTVSGHVVSNVDKRFRIFGKSWFAGDEGAPDILTDPALLFAFLVDMSIMETEPLPAPSKERALKQYSDRQLSRARTDAAFAAFPMFGGTPKPEETDPMKRLAFDEWDPKAFLTALNKHADELLGKFMHASHAAYAAFEARQRQRTQQYGQQSAEVFESYSTFFPLFQEILIPFFAKHGVTGPAADNAVISFAKNAERNPVDFVVYMGHIKHPKIGRLPPPQDGLSVTWTLGAHPVTGAIMTDHSHSWYLSPRGTVATDPSNLLVALLMARTPSPSAKALSLPSSRFPSR